MVEKKDQSSEIKSNFLGPLAYQALQVQVRWSRRVQYRQIRLSDVENLRSDPRPVVDSSDPGRCDENCHKKERKKLPEAKV